MAAPIGYDVRAALEGLANLDFKSLGDFNLGGVGVFRCGAGVSPWERHPDGDELLHVIEGAVDIEILDEQDSVTIQLEAGELLIVPSGHWHRHVVADRLAELYATSGTTEHSTADDPRSEG